MTKKQEIQLFEEKKVRTVWDSETEQWYFCVVDVCHILTDQPDYDHAKNYWKVLKHRLIKEGNESVTNCNQLKMVSPKDGKKYNTDVADQEQLFRLIQSIPSPKAEPFKIWMAQVAAALQKLHENSWRAKPGNRPFPRPRQAIICCRRRKRKNKMLLVLLNND